jgi:hypothetical protein
MKRWGELKDTRFDEKELKTDLGKDNFIFVGSSCDMFADDIKGEWIEKTIEHCKNYPFNNYLFQSKNPARFYGKWFPENTTFCTTIESNIIYPQMGNTPEPLERSGLIGPFQGMITIEPIMDFDLIPFVKMLKKARPIQINIGADSGNNNLPEPSKEKVLKLISELSEFTTVFQKDNLKRLLK